MNRRGIARFTRKEAFKHYKILFVIITEGKTEENYFTMLKKLKKENIEIVCKKGKHSSVIHLVNTINEEIENRDLNEHSECWIILDNDVLLRKDINKLREWINSTNSETKKSVGLSSPMFEYWLLLHYEVPRADVSKANCLLYLKKWIPEYKKPFKNCSMITNHISDACENAKKKEITLGSTKNGTNLHHLVNRLYQ